MRRWSAFLLARLLFAAFFVFTSIYCALANSTLVYENIHKLGMFPPLKAAVRLHPLMFVAILAVTLVFFATDRLPGVPVTMGGRIMRWLLLILLVPATFFVWKSSLLDTLQNDVYSFYWGVLALVPLAIVAVMDWCEIASRTEWNLKAPDEDYGLFRAAFYSAFFVAGSFTLSVYLRGLAEWDWQTGLAAWFWSGVYHFLIGALGFTLVNLISVMSGWFRRPPKAFFVLLHLVLSAVSAVFLNAFVFPSISLSGWTAQAYSAILALTVAAYSAGLALRAHARRTGPVTSGFALAFFLPQQAVRVRLWTALRALAGVPFLIGITLFVLFQIAKMDWNFVLQQILALLLWLLVFRSFFKFVRLREKHPNYTGFMLAACLAILFSYRGLQANAGWVWDHTSQKASSREFLERYAGYDVSFRLIRNGVAPLGTPDQPFYKFLANNTGIRQEAGGDPAQVDIVPSLTPGAGPKPHIFVIVVDSLRRDYLSPYNSDVSFTPSIQRFAEESLVAENAFSHYGGTAMAEPSIWAGSMLLHRQTLAPFEPVNNLEKLIQGEKYLSFVSVDSVLRPLLGSWPNLRELDQDRFTMDYDLCTTAAELNRRLSEELGAGQAAFAYTQPQTLHISVIQRQGNQSISESNFGRFFGPYASRLARLDTCFGEFIQGLKDQNLYEDSIVVLTADHGDSLGEGGRWGHAYTIYPEILRIPLIMHVPAAIRARYDFDPKALTFSTDITPTLYYLLGHTDQSPSEFVGRPLLTAAREEREVFLKPNHLVASSYGAVYGILSGDAQSLYVSDGVNYQDYFFDMDDPTNSQGVNNPEKVKYRDLIREKLLELARTYHFLGAEPPEPVAPSRASR